MTRWGQDAAQVITRKGCAPQRRDIQAASLFRDSFHGSDSSRSTHFLQGKVAQAESGPPPLRLPLRR